MTDSPTTLDLLRHGACAGGDIFRGTTDSALTEDGWRQMAAAVAPHRGWHRVLTSPLQRCRAFAEKHASDRGLPLQVDPGLREIHFGAWEGRDITALWREEADALEHYYRFPNTITPPNGEPLTTARDRLAVTWRALLDQHRGEHLLLVLHGGAIRLLLCQVLGAPLTSCQHFSIPHGCLIRLRVYHLPDGEVPQLVFLQPGEADG